MWLLQLPLFIASYAWLFGSLLLPCMLLIRWGAAKWRLLHFLAGTRSRWLLIWGCFGFAEVSAVEVLLWLKDVELPPFDSLGWAGMAVSGVLYTFHIHTEYIGVEFFLGLILKAIGDAAIDCGLAAMAWWIYSVLNAKTHARIERYGICLVFSACLFGVANNSFFWRTACYDCFAPHGVPFTYFHEGGFAGGSGFVWTGLVGNFVVVLVLALGLGLLWSKVAQRTFPEVRSES